MVAISRQHRPYRRRRLIVSLSLTTASVATSALAMAVLVLLLTDDRRIFCNGRNHYGSNDASTRRMPLAGIFGLNNGNRSGGDDAKRGKEQPPPPPPAATNVAQRQPPPPPEYNPNDSRHSARGESLPPPPPLPASSTTFVRTQDSRQNPKSMVPPQFRNRDPRYPPQQQQQQQQQQDSQRRPPPPPRPSMGSTPSDQQSQDTEQTESGRPGDETPSTPSLLEQERKKDEEERDFPNIQLQNDEGGAYQREEQELQQQQQPPPLPLLPLWGAGGSNPYPMQQQQQQQHPPPEGHPGWTTESYPSSQQSWQTPANDVGEGAPPPLPSQQQYYDQSYGPGPNPYYYGDTTGVGDFDNTNDDSSFLYLQDELNESLVRESSLITQLDNLTTAVVVMEQREELHMRQLDVLTERVIDVETKAAEDRNLLVEYEANCTALGNTIVGLQDDLEEWRRQCQELMQRREMDQETLVELKHAIKEKEIEAEELAVAMEQLRMTEKRREAGSSKLSSQAGGGGILAWLFGGWFGVGSSGSSARQDELIREEAFEMAKSTLLRALQSERANVHELEAAVASLQQNNSAISEMVESRDILIDELNNRIAVFEEDKVVLKAALRQLQKEMQEEAPKAQKLLDDLAEAEQEVNRLRADMNSIIETHQEELVALQSTISLKQKTIADVESNLTAVGTYVDKLEERLTSFAVTRRDMEEREKRCKEIEKAAEASEAQRKDLAVRVEEYQKGEEELKKLLEELASERAKLQKETRKLYTEQEFRVAELEQLESKCKALEAKSSTVDEDLQEWKDRCESLSSDLEASKRVNSALEQQVETLEQYQGKLDSLQLQNEELQGDIKRVEGQLLSVTEEKDMLAEKIANTTSAAVEKVNSLEVTQREDDEATGDELSATPDEASQTSQPGIQSPRPPPRRPNSLSPPQRPKRTVLLRSLRKQFSKLTGIHGAITPSSKMISQGAGTRSGPPSMPGTFDGRGLGAKSMSKARPTAD